MRAARQLGAKHVASGLLPVGLLALLLSHMPAPPPLWAEVQATGKLAPLDFPPPVPADNPQTPAKIALGKQLFFDPRLSGDNKTSCSTCHRPDKAFSDGRERGQSPAGKDLGRSTPGLLNVAYLKSFFWDGRAGSLEDQALKPLQSPAEMNQDLGELEKELADIPGYRQQFQDVFGHDPTAREVARALASFERTLVAMNSPLDRYLRGDDKALTEEQRNGLELFLGDGGCIRCHNGPLLSDGKFYRLGLPARGALGEDPGRGKITGLARERGAFRVPTLRNVALTSP